MAGKTSHIKRKAAKHPVPRTRKQAVEAIAELGRRQRERQQIKAKMNDKLTAIRKRYNEEAHPSGETIATIIDGIRSYCEAHQNELTGGGKIKSADLSSGEVGWRMSAPKVVFRNAKKTITALKKTSLLRFIRIKEEVNKEEILSTRTMAATAGSDEKNREILQAVKAMAKLKKIRSIRIEQEETFWVKPYETKLEEVVS